MIVNNGELRLLSKCFNVLLCTIILECTAILYMLMKDVLIG